MSRTLKSVFLQLYFGAMVVFTALCHGYSSDIETMPRYKIGLCVVATGKYSSLADKMIESARPYFCKDHDVTFFVFTDGKIAEAKDVVRIEQARLGWPYDTLKRFHIYEAHKEMFASMDYVFACDADMLFVAPVGNEILGDLVGTRHTVQTGSTGTYERKKKSTAYVGKKQGKTYFAGGFYGGRTKEFIKLVSTLKENVDEDLKQDYIARWHDESHLNRYFVDHPPKITLTPSYCYPEGWDLPYEKKLIATQKNHDELRK